mmetsp:Transcript_22746/g.35622  ORF Transcript_22746/g.35622 Transcript_22746/m.35622 type:complete len:130 (+) Transcript_22746:2626-3015(+)|eukprot:CAMPEP_0184292568 /NCGR_PEP_ID=MMETSP1049-20130417/4319_1 /TAXON_ID=77928 /ORGANISM="Proteomonas sulcata, Strain CCMP704" /LENGTH=129 /DNA_ID=CAMNT_0026600385 /DNA_START=2623 /DNA_END=3012 /DNA_ORIENTATION=+
MSELAESIEDVEMIDISKKEISDVMKDLPLEEKGHNFQSFNLLEELRYKKTEKRITLPYLTKYERARILGARALQISMGAPIMVELISETDPLDIASKELIYRKIPITIRRYLPRGNHEDWNLEELIID